MLFGIYLEIVSKTESHYSYGLLNHMLGQPVQILQQNKFIFNLLDLRASLVAQLVKKNPPAVQNPGRPGFDPWVGKIPWRRERLPTPVFCLENPVDCIVHGVTKSSTQLRDFHTHIEFKRLKLSSSYWTLLPAVKNKPLLFYFIFFWPRGM